MHARQLASTADLVITNHAMLLMDIEREENLLPDYRYVIIDEAQRLEKAARKCFGNKLEYNTVKCLGALVRLTSSNCLPSWRK